MKSGRKGKVVLVTGGAGGIPGGGGGGGAGAHTSNSGSHAGAGGTGARGEVRIMYW